MTGNTLQSSAARVPLSGTPTIPGNGAPQISAGPGVSPPPSSWAPPFSQPYSAANASNTNATNPQLTGGYWNQLTQMLAGPSYTPKTGSSVSAPVIPKTPTINGGGLLGGGRK